MTNDRSQNEILISVLRRNALTRDLKLPVRNGERGTTRLVHTNRNELE